MSGDVLILGDMVLDNISHPWAMPSKVSGGMEQQLGVSQLIGGARVVDAMGQAPLPLKWQGRWRGPNASSNNDIMIAMAQAGQQIACSWGEYFYNVVLKAYSFEYEDYFEIMYNLELIVIPDDVTQGGSSLDDLVGGDMSTASGVAQWQ